MKENYLVFIDESWDHNLDKTKFDNYYNIFVLCAVVIKESDYNKLDKEIKSIKYKYRDSDDIILHTAEITRPNKSRDDRNLLFNDPRFRRDFYTDINNLIASSPIQILYCAIDKNKMVKQYGYHAEDPYLFSFENLLNRILRAVWWWVCDIYPEKRTNTENIKLETEMIKLRTMWSKFYTWSEIWSRVSSFTLKDKNTGINGLQFVDLIVSPIGRHLLWKEPRPWNEVSYQVIKSKLPSWWYTIFP